MNTESRTRIGSDGKLRGAGRPLSKERDCLTPECANKVGGEQKNKGARGLCHYCHGVATRLVFHNKTTWKELEALGLATPPYKTLFEKVFNEKKAQNDSKRS